MRFGRRQVHLMSSILVINAAGRETRVALVEGGRLAELHIDRGDDRGVIRKAISVSSNGGSRRGSSQSW